VVGLALAGCGAGTASPSTSDLDEVTWHLRSGVVDGVAVNPLDGSRLSLRVDGDAAGGEVGCNQFGMSWDGEGSQISVGEIAVSLIACGQEADPAELPFLEGLSRVSEGVRDGARLTLSGPDVELVFTR